MEMVVLMHATFSAIAQCLERFSRCTVAVGGCGSRVMSPEKARIRQQ